MAISKKILKHLDANKIKYEIIKHKKVYTAFDLSQTLRRAMKEISKSLLVKVDAKPVVVIVPAHYRIDLAKIKQVFKAKKAELLNEKKMLKALGTKNQAVHAFGSLHKVTVALDKALLKVEKAIFRTGSFTESLRLKVKDFAKLEKPTLGVFGKAGKK